MASQDLVGRPLVPFFDSDENVNDSLQFAEGDDKREEMNIDARVWDKNLGYFVYPSEQQMAISSTKVTIAVETRESRMDSGSKLLLTPSMMLSSSAPNSFAADRNTLHATSDDARPHSSSEKHGSKPKTRSNTPGRQRKESERVENVFAANTLSKKGKNKGSNTNSNGAQSSNSQQSRNGKHKEQLSASGKWAWSAFQSSPDPTELPMPPFLIKSTGGLGNGNGSLPMTTSAALSPPRTPPSALYTSAPTVSPLPPGLSPAQAPQPPASQPPLPPMPTAPPEAKTTTSISVESSMTQDLRRMLNIGGG